MPKQRQELARSQRCQILVLALHEKYHRAGCPVLQTVHVDVQQYQSRAPFAGARFAAPTLYRTVLLAVYGFVDVRVCKMHTRGQQQEARALQATTGNLAKFVGS
mmetsp:Transcript_14070/g.27791  ORF Transcript_14070/g.27791 Transcript_14070/m.27791 type:complete len:104 (-) Transcript_14070:64-375(-)